ncbi:hypothetical protein mRhiFer1_010201 [Rhinolophus ferrumequinum]|uniref:Uncharacterized protein n=1 Tax=Rhinolophus ferrumequinum TaxID=59479 RepID=A0A7J7X5E1_RHIFE|nr:hypothetical protein mRhiFer1_010201 [Rhinolophus ferrumequinum]
MDEAPSPGPALCVWGGGGVENQDFLLLGEDLLVTSPLWQAESCSSLASFQPILQRPRVNKCLWNASAQSADLPASVGVTALPSGSVCLPVGPGLGDRTMTANHRCLKSEERIGLHGDRSQPGQALETQGGVGPAWSPGL